MIETCTVATGETFEVDSFLLANPEISRAVDLAQRRQDAEQYFYEWGIREGQSQVRIEVLGEIEEARAKKLRSLPELDRYVTSILGVSMSLGRASGDLPIDVDLSAQDYDPQVAQMVDDDIDKLFLDLGAGFTRHYCANVVYADVAVSPTTDVLCWGEKLPFEDASFDGVVCRSVLEHIKTPWTVAEELMRVVRPGGTMIVDWPFLQPVHGYPNHFFNATEQGGRSLFESKCRQVESSVPEFLGPIFSLRWILAEWAQGLSTEDLSVFRTVKVGDLLDQTPPTILEHNSWARNLKDGTRNAISARHRYVITR